MGERERVRERDRGGGDPSQQARKTAWPPVCHLALPLPYSFSCMWCSLLRVQGLGFRVQGSGFKVQGSGCSVQGAGFRVQASGCHLTELLYSFRMWCSLPRVRVQPGY